MGFGVLSDRPPELVAYDLEMDGTLLNNPVGISCIKGKITEYKARVPSTWVNG